MMRHIVRSLVIVSVSLAMLGCGKDESASAATTTQAPALPADVQQISEAVNSSTIATTSTTSTAVVEGQAGAPAEAVGDTLVATGEFVSPVRSELAAKIPGRVARMFVEEGSRVSKGEPVLELETDYLRLNLQRAAADTARAKAMADDAWRDMERKKELIAKDSIPRATYDRSLANYEQARAGYQSASAQAQLFRQQIADSTVRSPITGVVSSKRTDVGQRLGDNTVAVVITQLSPLKLRFSVPERYLGQVQRGDHVVARVDPYPNESFAGTITVVGGVIDPSTRTMFAEAEFANRDGRLRPGLFARVETKLK